MTDRKLTMAEFIERYRIPRGTAYKLTALGEIPHVKIGKRVYFDGQELEEWFRSYHRGPDITVVDHPARRAG